jgi:acyl homoserine lactone synthase
MLRFLSSPELSGRPTLQNSMFKDRTTQFRDRLGWNVTVDAHGWERDEFDYVNPLYVIWELPDGTHGGSMRFLPTTGPTMVNEHFSDLIDGGRLVDQDTWECTRFCLSERADKSASAMLMLGGAQVGAGFSLRYAVGVFDARMTRIYNVLGWRPDVIGMRGSGKAQIQLGRWAFSEATRLALAERAGVPADLSQSWFRDSLAQNAVAA